MHTLGLDGEAGLGSAVRVGGQNEREGLDVLVHTAHDGGLRVVDTSISHCRTMLRACAVCVLSVG